MGVLTVTATDTGVTVAGSEFNPGTVINLASMHYEPKDGSTGRNFGPGGIIGFTDEEGAFTITFSRTFIVGKCHTPGTATASVFESQATASGEVS